VNRLLSSRTAWRQWVTEVQQLLAEHGLETDFFGFNDLEELASLRYTPEQVLKTAQLRTTNRAERAGSTT
jgi:hypothetical protein